MPIFTKEISEEFQGNSDLNVAEAIGGEDSAFKKEIYHFDVINATAPSSGCLFDKAADGREKLSILILLLGINLMIIKMRTRIRE